MTLDSDTILGRVRKLYDLNYDLTQQAIILNKHNQLRATIPAANMQTLVQYILLQYYCITC